MKPHQFAVVLCVASGISISFAEPEKPPAPTSPVVHRVPAFASWTIQFKYQEDEMPAKPLDSRVESLTVTKTNKTVWEQRLLKSGQKEDKWIFDGIQLMTADNGKSIVPIAPPTPEEPISPDYSDYRRSDFEELDWVSLSTYKGLGTYQGKPVYLFEVAKSERKNVACLSTETQLPLYASDGKVVRTFIYNPPPSEPLVPPAKFLAVVAAHKRGLESLKFHPSPP